MQLTAYKAVAAGVGPGYQSEKYKLPFNKMAVSTPNIEIFRGKN